MDIITACPRESDKLLNLTKCLAILNVSNIFDTMLHEQSRRDRYIVERVPDRYGIVAVVIK